MEKISESVVEVCRDIDPSLRPTSLLRCLGEDELKGDLRSSSKPGAIHIGEDLGPYLSEERERGSLWWDHGAVLYEFRKRDSDRDVSENMSKMTWSLVQKLSADPACRFVRGCTMEDTGTRFWYADHSVMLVTERVDFNRDYRVLASFFARLAFAPLSQLGWDSSIKRISSKGFRIHIKDKTYRTERYLSNPATEKRSASRTTGWTTTNLGSILSAISQHPWGQEASQDPRAELSIEERLAYFVRIYASDIVQVDGLADSTRRMRKNYDFTHDQQELPIAASESANGEWSTQEERSSNGPQYAYREVTPPFKVHSLSSKAHHRVVMERGEVLYAVKKVSHVFSACADVAYALFLMRTVGWAHRDISPGNTLVFPTSHGGIRGVLTDFEYAKRFDDNSPIHAMRAGTPGFAAVEVQKGGFDAGTDRKRKRYDEAQPPPVWTFCAAHDLEPVWWIVVWFIFRHYRRSALHSPQDVPPSQANDKDSRTHKKFYDALFSGPFNSNSYYGRSSFLRGHDEYEVVGALKRYWPVDLLTEVCGDLAHDFIDFYAEDTYPWVTPPVLYEKVMAACSKAAKLDGELETLPFIKTR
ncbi:hypothetical protein C8T65DRAFT_736033 [Cerioporus squamosus]|nr:hypothetical protein C8T65DRAFT_736033 [Cerioporus squamosus]